MHNFPAFELHGNGILTLEGYNLKVTDIYLDDNETNDIMVDYNFVDDKVPEDIDMFEERLQSFMISLLPNNDG